MSSPVKRKPMLKHSFTTFNEKAATFMYGQGAKIRALYTHDDLTCYEVSLRGRKQCRLLAAPEYIEQTATFNVLTLVEKRITPPIYTLKVNGQFAIMQDVGGNKDEYFGLSRDPALLGKTSEPSELTELKTWEDLKGFVDDALSIDYRHVKIFIGYGPFSEIPYRETHDLLMFKRVIDNKLNPPELEAENG